MTTAESQLFEQLVKVRDSFNLIKKQCDQVEQNLTQFGTQLEILCRRYNVMTTMIFDSKEAADQYLVVHKTISAVPVECVSIDGSWLLQRESMEPFWLCYDHVFRPEVIFKMYGGGI